MAQLPIMPLNVPALLADTSHMSVVQFGAYVRLLGTMWLHGGQLVDNEDELARIAGISRDRWRANCEAIMRPMTVEDGVVTQKRLTATWLSVQETRQRRAAAGLKRWTGRTK